MRHLTNEQREALQAFQVVYSKLNKQWYGKLELRKGGAMLTVTTAYLDSPDDAWSELGKELEEAFKIFKL